MAACLISGLAFLTVGWVFGNPPGASPDEPAALVKALATGHLELSGERYTAPLPPYTAPAWRAWTVASTRSYSLPVRQVPASLSVCMAFFPDKTAACLQDAPALTGTQDVQAPTIEGIYPPFLFLPLGLAARLVTSPNGEFYAARLASAAISILLLGAASWCATIRRHTLWPACGLALVATPMVLFLAASVTTNGVEIAAAICFWAGLLRIRQDDSPNLAWLAMGVGGGIMALSRQIDDLWLITGAALFICLLGPTSALRRFRAAGRYSIVGIGIAGIGGLVGLAWDVFATPPFPVSLSVAIDNRPTVTDAESLAHQAVGVFGWLDTPIPNGIEHAWLIAIGGLVIIALAVGTRRQRFVLVGTAVAIAAMTAAVQMFLIAQTGFSMQTRYVLGVAVALPLLSAEVIAERHESRRLVRMSPALLLSVMVVVSAGQWIGYYTNARRYGIGLDTPGSLLSQAAWQPPGGTFVWLLVVAIGVALLSGAGLVMAVASRERTHPV